MRGKFFSRARFAYVTQKPHFMVFAHLAYLDGDSGSPFPRLLHNEIVLFGFHKNCVRSVIQRMPGMLAHKNILIPNYPIIRDKIKKLKVKESLWQDQKKIQK